MCKYFPSRTISKYLCLMLFVYTCMFCFIFVYGLICGFELRKGWHIYGKNFEMRIILFMIGFDLIILSWYNRHGRLGAKNNYLTLYLGLSMYVSVYQYLYKRRFFFASNLSSWGRSHVGSLFNPFTATACNISGLKDARRRLQTVYCPVL